MSIKDERNHIALEIRSNEVLEKLLAMVKSIYTRSIDFPKHSIKLRHLYSLNYVNYYCRTRWDHLENQYVIPIQSQCFRIG
jgi:hypothetical protein